MYRGYNIHDLAEKSNFEETVYLILNGNLPTKSQLASFDAQLRSNRTIPNEIVEIIRVTQKSHPMDVKYL